MRPLINKDTVMCMSLAARPGNFGTRFHNFLYEELGLDYLYKAFRTQDIVGAIANEAGVPGRQIGTIDIYDDFTLVDVPFDYAQQVLDLMSSATIRNQAATIRLTTAQDDVPPRRSQHKDRGMPRRKPSPRGQGDWAARPRKRPARGAKHE